MNNCGQCKYYEALDRAPETPVTVPMKGVCCHDRSTVAWFPAEGPQGAVGIQKFFIDREVRRLRTACVDFKPAV